MQLPPSLSHAHTFSRFNNSDLKCTAGARWRKNKRKNKRKEKRKKKKKKTEKKLLYLQQIGDHSRISADRDILPCH